MVSVSLKLTTKTKEGYHERAHVVPNDFVRRIVRLPHQLLARARKMQTKRGDNQ